MAVKDITTLGAVGGGDAGRAGVNTGAIQSALDQGGAYIPHSPGGFVVNGGQLVVRTPGVRVIGDGSMGSNPDWGTTSTLQGLGAGDYLTFSPNSGGSSCRGVAIRPFGASQQAGGDAFLKMQGTDVRLSDMYFNSPNIGIAAVLAPGAAGEFWMDDILMEGAIKQAGVLCNIGNSAMSMRHVIMFPTDPQPAYGVLVRSVGELIMCGGCDIIQMGTCLALVPGIGGEKGRFCTAVFVSDCLFDSGNGVGCIYIGPQGDGWVSVCKFTNVWTSTYDNGGGNWNTNGITLDGALVTPGGPFPAIRDVNFVNCNGQNFGRHCGFYARNATDITVAHSSFYSNFNGIQTKNCTGILQGNRCSGNTAYGVLLEHSAMVFNPLDHMLGGNGVGQYKLLP